MSFTRAFAGACRALLRVALPLALAAGLAGFVSPEQMRNMRRPPFELANLTCDQLWYLREKIRADGGICPRDERARRAFFRTRTCISPDERVLPAEVRTYLDAVRKAEQARACDAE